MIETPEGGFYWSNPVSKGRHFSSFDLFFYVFAEKCDEDDRQNDIDGCKWNHRAHNWYCVEYVYGYREDVSGYLGAYSILLEDAMKWSCDVRCKDLERIKENGGNGLQDVIDDWCAKQSWTPILKPDFKNKKIAVPWCEWFGVEERGS